MPSDEATRLAMCIPALFCAPGTRNLDIANAADAEFAKVLAVAMKAVEWRAWIREMKGDDRVTLPVAAELIVLVDEWRAASDAPIPEVVAGIMEPTSDAKIEQQIKLGKCSVCGYEKLIPGQTLCPTSHHQAGRELVVEGA